MLLEGRGVDRLSYDQVFKIDPVYPSLPPSMSHYRRGWVVFQCAGLVVVQTAPLASAGNSQCGYNPPDSKGEILYYPSLHSTISFILNNRDLQAIMAGCLLAVYFTF